MLEEENVRWLPVPNKVRSVLSLEMPPLHLCTSAFVLPFDQCNNVLLSHVLKRGLDLIGGHLEWKPGVPRRFETPQEGALRESSEEAGAELEDLRLLGYKEMYVSAPPLGYRYPTPISYAVYFGARLVNYTGTRVPEECGEPKLISPEDAFDIQAIERHKSFYLRAYRMFAM